MSWTFTEGDVDSPDVLELLELHFRDMRSISPPEACHVLPADGLNEAGSVPSASCEVAISLVVQVTVALPPVAVAATLESSGALRSMP